MTVFVPSSKDQRHRLAPLRELVTCSNTLNDGTEVQRFNFNSCLLPQCTNLGTSRRKTSSFHRAFSDRVEIVLPQCTRSLCPVRLCISFSPIVATLQVSGKDDPTESFENLRVLYDRSKAQDRIHPKSIGGGSSPRTCSGRSLRSIRPSRFAQRVQQLGRDCTHSVCGPSTPCTAPYWRIMCSCSPHRGLRVMNQNRSTERWRVRVWSKSTSIPPIVSG